MADKPAAKGWIETEKVSFTLPMVTHLHLHLH